MRSFTNLLKCALFLCVLTCQPKAFGQIISTLAGSTSSGSTGDGGQSTAARLNNPYGVAVDGSGNIYIVDESNDRIRKITISTGVISLVAGSGFLTGDGGAATAARVNSPRGVAVDGSGNIYIAESSGNRIRKVTASTGIITTIAGTGSAGSTGDNSAATGAKVSSPYGIALDGSGNVYIADNGNNKIRKITVSTGIITTIAGTGSTGNTGDGSAATAAKLSSPRGVAVDASGNVYIADRSNNRIRKIDAATSVISAFAGTGTSGSTGDGSPATAAKFNQPTGLSFDPSGNLVIADEGNDRIRVVNMSTGIISLLAGSSSGFSGDGSAATAARLDAPGQAAYSSGGDFYIADAGNNRIRVVKQNHVPSFTGGSHQTLTVCANSVSNSLNSLLAVTDVDAGQTLTWSSSMTPGHGTLVAAATATATGSSVTPTGLTYTPTISYTGTDSFIVQVSDGITTAKDTIVVTVSAAPSAPASIAGTLNVCSGGGTTTLTDATSGGTWSSVTTSVATIGTSGVVTGVAAGTTTISYTVTNSGGCSSAATVIVTVDPTPPPAAIGGTKTVCETATTTLNDATAGGVWSSAGTSIATVGSTGIVTGVTAGTTTISYTLSNGCGTGAAIATVTVNPAPATPAPITGSLLVCEGGGTTLLSDATSGGVWSSSIGLRAGINSSSGLVTGVFGGGTTTISYTITNSCGSAAATAVVTVTSTPGTPSNITGTLTVCAGGGTTLLDDITTGGTWSSVSTAVATIDAGGIVTGVTAGTSLISYTVTNLCGSAARTKTVTVNPLPVPASVSGTLTVCASGTTSLLSDATPGGVWSSTNTAAATINSSGLVTGASVGTTTISYTVTTLGCVGAATATVTVNTLPSAPAAITGTQVVCEGGATTTLSDVTTGGVWSSTAAANATVDASGMVTGVAAGTPTISYTLTNLCGSVAATAVVTVNPLPFAAAITGTASVCAAGATTLLSDATTGGVWSSTAFPVATINSTGTVTGVAAGTTLISYTVTNSCGTIAATKIVTVNPLPSPPALITGTKTTCEAGGTTLLSDATTGGAWTSVTASVATVDGAGLVTGVTAGTSRISYTVTNGCGSASTFVTVTVNPLASVATITGTRSVCEAGATTVLSDATIGGVWNSDNASVATVNTTGTVTGVTAGTATISYTKTTTCGSATATAIVTVNPLPATPAPITGTAVVCEGGATTTLGETTTGGVWSSDNTAVATVDASGVVTGVVTGTANIAYTKTNGCGSTPTSIVVTVNPLPVIPAAITGTYSVCEDGATTQLDDITSGGTWSSDNTAAATVDNTGLVTGVTAGSATISYVMANSCGSAQSTAVVVVNPLPVVPAAITGTASVCEGGATTSLNNATPGGAWSSDHTLIATVDASGMVTGVNAGTATISYTETTVCGSQSATAVVTVNPLPAHPATISGTPVVCEGGATTMLTNAVAGGAWNSDNTSIATVDASGIVTGVATGLATISYTITNGCGSDRVTTTVTVNPLPFAAAISGTPIVCAGGATTALTDAIAGGTWSSDNNSIASVDAGGLVTGGTAGTANITYTVINSCGTATASTPVTVKPLVSAPSISGTTTLCASTNTPLVGVVAGGTWTTDNAAIATVDAAGTLIGVAGGTTNISYTVSNSCNSASAGVPVTVLAGPAAITGTPNVCEGATTALSNPFSGGTWSSSNAAVATVDSVSGVVTGIAAAGLPTITYTAPSGCKVTTLVTVNQLPSAISGATTLCGGGAVTTLSNLVAGGTWTSSDPGVANTSAGGPGIGIITGISFGFPTITYTLPTGCAVATGLTVNPVPAPIFGVTDVCMGSDIALSSALTGGVWSSSDLAIASVDAGMGNVTGLSAGTANITYTIPATGCMAIAPVIFRDAPAPITGTTSVCEGAMTALSSATPGGIWSSSDASVASVNNLGEVSGLLSGAPSISYTIGTGCSVSTIVVVNPLPATPDPISGTTTLCAATASILSELTPGGVWSSSNLSVASVSSSGIVIGFGAGVTAISYTVTNSCGSTSVISPVTVNPLPVAPAPITGTTIVCNGSSSTLADATFGGAWTSDDITVATISTSGVVTALSVGTATISYTKVNTCGTVATTAVVTINPLPSAGSITAGTSALCNGSATTFTDPVAGGLWSSSNTAVATVSTTGDVTGVGAGLANISYSTFNSCGSATVMSALTVNPIPVVTTAITGTTEVCPGIGSPLHNATPDGAWSSSNLAVATVNSTGLVTGVAAGTSVISYTKANGCGTASVIKTFTVNPMPVADPITGIPVVCSGSITLLHEPPTGGTWLSDDNTVAMVTGTGIVSGLAPGVATISYIATNSCGSSSAATITVTVNQLPEAGTITGNAKVCMGDTIVLSNIISGGTWSSSDNGIATVSNSGVVTGVFTGNDNITYTYTNTCGTVTASFEVSVRMAGECTAGAGTLANSTVTELKAYPNPNEGTFTVNLQSGSDEQVHVIITNVVGEKVKEYTTTTNKELSITLSNAPGIYLISATTEHDKYLAKVVVR